MIVECTIEACEERKIVESDTFVCSVSSAHHDGELDTVVVVKQQIGHQQHALGDCPVPTSVHEPPLPMPRAKVADAFARFFEKANEAWNACGSPEGAADFRARHSWQSEAMQVAA